MKNNNKSTKSGIRPVRETRYFSEDFRKARVKEYQEGICSVTDISRLYDVTRSAVYKWIARYSINYQKSIRKVVELESETIKRKELEKRLSEVEQLLGQKTVEVEFYRRLVEIAEEKFNIEIKKSVGSMLSSGFGKISKKGETKG